MQRTKADESPVVRILESLGLQLHIATTFGINQVYPVLILQRI